MKYLALCFEIKQEVYIHGVDLYPATNTARILLDTYRSYAHGEPWAILGHDRGCKKLSEDLPIDVGKDVNVMSQQELAGISDEQVADAIQCGMHHPLWLGLRDTEAFIEALAGRALDWTGQGRVDEYFLKSYPRRRRWMALVNTMVVSCNGMASALPDSNEILVLPLGVEIFASCERKARECFGPPKSPSW
jgi:hypothetical protein